MYLLLLVFMGFSIFLTIVMALTSVLEPYSGKVRSRLRKVRLLDTASTDKIIEKEGLVWRLLRPMYHIVLASIKLSDQQRLNLRDRLEKAGVAWTPEHFYALKLLIVMGIFTLGVLLSLTNPGGNWLNWLVMMGLGFFLPDLYLRSKMLTWREKILQEFPDFIDTTRSYLGSGLSIFQTIKQVKEISGPGLAPLLAKLSAELEVYDQITALRRFGHRAGILEVQNFVVAIEQGISAGIPLKDIFLSQSHLMRELRKLTMKRRIRQKPIYLALVGGLLFINIFIIVGLPALLTIMSIRGIAE
ncbi:MAG TPA: type II secretion system F family protein [Bacillota bacterium]|nr:type II secretion system F family protein [Bacillota bacterium]